jgi:hypothetical protein
LINTMDDISSSKIHEDAIIFSTHKINAWNATIQRNAIIILGGDREILQDILNFKKSAAMKKVDLAEQNFKADITTEQYDFALVPTTQDGDFDLVQANEIKVP